METLANAVHREPWNKGKIVGQKAPFKVKDIWALRVRFQMANRVRELALFNLVNHCGNRYLKLATFWGGCPLISEADVHCRAARLHVTHPAARLGQRLLPPAAN